MIYVGIDVSKDKHDCYIVNSDGKVLADVFTVENNLEGFDLLFQRLKSGQSQILCKLQMRQEQSRIQCARQRIYPTAALCAV